MNGLPSQVWNLMQVRLWSTVSICDVTKEFSLVWGILVTVSSPTDTSKWVRIFTTSGLTHCWNKTRKSLKNDENEKKATWYNRAATARICIAVYQIYFFVLSLAFKDKHSFIYISKQFGIVIKGCRVSQWRNCCKDVTSCTLSTWRLFLMVHKTYHHVK